MARRKTTEVDLCDSPVVISFDPGGTTGWSIFQCHPESLIQNDVRVLDNIDYWKMGQFSGLENKQATECFELVKSWPGCAVVIEDFILRKMSKDEDLLAPVRLIAKIELLLWQEGIRSFRQQPSEAKTTATDERLKSWGLYVPGEEHARDASRHSITWLRKTKEKAKLRVYSWPHLYGIGMEYGPTQEEFDALLAKQNTNGRARVA